MVADEISAAPSIIENTVAVNGECVIDEDEVYRRKITAIFAKSVKGTVRHRILS